MKAPDIVDDRSIARAEAADFICVSKPVSRLNSLEEHQPAPACHGPNFNTCSVLTYYVIPPQLNRFVASKFCPLTMQIIINAPEGTSTAYAVEGTTTVTDLKSMIENREFIPGHLIKLVAGDSELLEGTLAGNGVEEDEELDLCLEIAGGMRAKWRKKRMRRLRRKRRKMRQRAR